MFQRDLFERFSHVHPVVPALLWVPALVACLMVSLCDAGLSSSARIGAVALGAAAWTLVEYVLHRFVFHAEPTHPRLRRVVYLLHGVHHDAPEDARRLLMPPLPAAGFAVLFFGLFVVALGTRLALPCFLGFGLGYLAYDYTHLVLHHGPARLSFLRRLKKHHMRHHHVQFDAGYGVSSMLWDRVFGTCVDAPVVVKRARRPGTPASAPGSDSRTPPLDRSAP